MFKGGKKQDRGMSTQNKTQGGQESKPESML